MKCETITFNSKIWLEKWYTEKDFQETNIPEVTFHNIVDFEAGLRKENFIGKFFHKVVTHESFHELITLVYCCQNAEKENSLLISLQTYSDTEMVNIQ